MGIAQHRKRRWERNPIIATTVASPQQRSINRLVPNNKSSSIESSLKLVQTTISSMLRTESNAAGNQPTFAPPEASKEIPILSYHGNSNDASPPEFSMIELNGNLIPPVEFPPEETCVRVFGKDRTVELGKLYREGPDKASGASVN